MSVSSGSFIVRCGASNLINLVKISNIQAGKFKPVRVFHSSSVKTQTAGSSSKENILIKLFFFCESCGILKPNVFLIKGVIRKRFYKKVGTVHSNKEFEITLDGRKLKTPAGQIFKVSSEPLALAIANEWDSQQEKILISSMHMVVFANSLVILSFISIKIRLLKFFYFLTDFFS